MTANAFRTSLFTLAILPALLLPGCGGDDGEQAATNPASGARYNAQETRGSTRQAPSIRIYMTDMEEFGEVAGVTASSDEFVRLTLRLENPQGEPLGGQTLEFSSLVGNESNENVLETDADGFATLRIRPVLPGEDILTFTGGGISKQLSLYITDEAYGHPMEHLQARAVELPEVDGVVPWRTMTSIKTREGSHGLLEPIFSDAVKALDGKNVRIQGFMMPLDNSEKQSHFILTSTPPSCFYCMPGGPENVIEIKTSKPMEFSFEPVVIAGRMELLESSDMGIFYRLNAATPEKP